MFGFIYRQNKLSLKMNFGLKLKIRQPTSTGQDPNVRRIRTDHLDISKKNTRQPLTDNKRFINTNQSSNNPKVTTKKTTSIKSVLGKSTSNYSRLTTQPIQRPAHFQHHRNNTAVEKIGSNGQVKKPSTINGSFKKKQNQEVCVAKNIGQSCSKETKQIKQTKEIKQLKAEKRYEIEKKVGSGTFGTVHRARDKKTLNIVAIKKVYQDKNYKNRQLQILKMINHPNALSMKDSFFTYEDGKQYLNVVMDYYSFNLYESLRKYGKKNPMPKLKLKIYAYQLFRSLLYLKNLKIAHRDIKPQNVLVNEETLKLVMCDFGSAKQLEPGQPNIAYICSRCYRAPELIFGNTEYTTQIDMWSVGCVIGEMFLGVPMFQGQSNIDQLVEIIKVLGCPSSEDILKMNPSYDLNQFKLPKINGKSWEKVFPGASYLGEQFIDLMKNVLIYNPSRRFTPIQALGHKFFNQLRDEKIYKQLCSRYKMDSFFNFKKTNEAKMSELQKLIPSWY